MKRRIDTSDIVMDVANRDNAPLRVVTPDGEYAVSTGQWEEHDGQYCYTLYTSDKVEPGVRLG